jgi:hypothetical protein
MVRGSLVVKGRNRVATRREAAMLRFRESAGQEERRVGLESIYVQAAEVGSAWCSFLAEKLTVFSMLRELKLT